MSLEIKPYVLDFKFSARTSRGEMSDRKVWFLKLIDKDGRFGIGEVAPIQRLSPEDVEDVPNFLERLCVDIEEIVTPESEEEVYDVVSKLVPPAIPSVRFGMEMAFLDLIHGGKKLIFSENLEKIKLPINGLVWMGDKNFMQEQIVEKLNQGFRCIKLKVGSLDFETEIEIIKSLRSVSEDLIIRLDANGSFQTNEVLFKLKELSKFNIHSIEQPIMPMQHEAMELVCNRSEIPIALDEELIGIYSSRDRVDLMQELKPHYVVIKPTLHGGFASSQEWIDLAEIHGIKWWITSYLESNLGLNAIAQFASTYSNSDEFHGLGTGGLYHNNITSPIVIDRGYFSYAKSSVWGDIDF
ncbi:o-succinylbenzoate synthase [Ekhidna lutea]|uniref:o-succinylbenzoate synthase n=1 Tax=Ekhidna lutea TaxID=447679 RepID=A0A239K6S4_EKHLU|nr:o-succinylbenzoate synthase [Ekhidna lutea]